MKNLGALPAWLLCLYLHLWALKVLPVLTLHLDVEALFKQETSGKCSEMQNSTKMIHLKMLPAWILDLDLDKLALFLAASDLWMVHAWFLRTVDVEALGAQPAWFLILWLVVEGAPAWLLRLYLDVGALVVLTGYFLKFWLVVEGAPPLPGGEQSAASCIQE